MDNYMTASIAKVQQPSIDIFGWIQFVTFGRKRYNLKKR
jgi:hypothetical protein